MDDDDLNQDWFYEDSQNVIKSAASPSQIGGVPNRSEYTTLNVPLDDEYSSVPIQHQMLPGSSQQQVVYHQPQVNVQQQRIYQQVETYDDSIQQKQISSQRQVTSRSIQRDQLLQHQQNENYNYGSGQSAQYQLGKPQVQAPEWDIMPQSRPNSQMQMRPNSQMQLRPDSKMQMNSSQQYHQMRNQSQQQFYPDQPQIYNDNMSQMPQAQQVQYASTSAVEPHFISSNQQQGTVYVQQTYPGGSQRLSGGMVQVDQMDTMHMNQVENQPYNITPPSTSNKKSRSQPQTGNQKQRKGQPQRPPQQIIIQQPSTSQLPQLGQPPMIMNQSQFNSQQSKATPKNRKPQKSIPTFEEITSRFQSATTNVRFGSKEDSDEFASILMQLMVNQNPSPEERINLSEKLDGLLSRANVLQKPLISNTPQMNQDIKPMKQPAKSRKKPPVQTQQIESQPSNYFPGQSQGFPNQPQPQTAGNTIILNCSNSVYSTNGPNPTYTQISTQQPQTFTVNQNEQAIDQSVKKPARRRPPKKSAQQQPQIQMQNENMPTVMQTAINQNGQQILICAPSGNTSTMQNSFMISYGGSDTIYTTPGSGDKQIVLQYQPMPVAQIQAPLMETPKEVADKVTKAKNCRQKKVSKFFDNLYEKIDKTDYITPFNGLSDIIDRLLPFAFNYEPDYSEEYLEKVDHEILRRFVHLDDRYKKVETKMRNIYYAEAMNKDEHAYELNMLLYLDAEYEKRRLDQDKINAKNDLDSFLRESEIIRAAFDISELEVKKQQLLVPDSTVNPHTSSYGTYEYHDFDENAFISVEVTPPPSPPKPKQNPKKRREKSKYLYASDSSEDEEENDQKTSESESAKRDNPSSVTELIDLNAIDVDAESLLMAQTPDAETIAAHEQTEAIDKALELLSRDLENVIPSVFSISESSTSLPFDLPLNLQEQPNASFTSNLTSPHLQQQSPALGMMPAMNISAQTSFVPSNPTSISNVPSYPPISPFGRVMKTPPVQQKEFQQLPAKFPSTSINQIPMQSSITSFALSPPKQQQLQAPTFPKSQSIHNIPPSNLPPHLHQQNMGPSPINIMKPPPILKPNTMSTIGLAKSQIDNNNIMADKFVQPQLPMAASNIPQFKPINVDNSLFAEMSGTSSSLNQSKDQPPITMESLVQKRPPPKPLEPPAAFDNPHLLKPYQSAVNQPSLKQRLLQPQHLKNANFIPDSTSYNELMEKMKNGQSKNEPLPSSSSIIPSTPINMPKLAAVSMIESARLLGNMNQKLQARKSSKIQSDSGQIDSIPKSSENLPTVIENSQGNRGTPLTTKSSNQHLKHKMPDKKLATVVGMEDSDDESGSSKSKKPKIQQNFAKLGPPTPLDVVSSHTSAICRPSPSNTSALPIKLRFKVGNTTNGDSAYPGLQNQNEAPPSTSKSALTSNLLPESNVQNQIVSKSTVIEAKSEKDQGNLAKKELKRQRKEEKKLRKKQEKFEKKRRSNEDTQQLASNEEKPIKLKIRIGPKDENMIESNKQEVPIPKVEIPKVEKRVEKLKIRIAPLEKEEIDLNAKKSKKLKRPRSSSNERPPKLVAQKVDELEVLEPKVPKIKIKFGGNNKDLPTISEPKNESKSKSKNSKKEALDNKDLISESKNESKLKSSKSTNSKKEVLDKKSSTIVSSSQPIKLNQQKTSIKSFTLKPVSQIPNASKLTTSNVTPNISPNVMQLMPPITTQLSIPELNPKPILMPSTQPQFSDDDSDDADNARLSNQTKNLISNFTKLK